MFQYHPNPKDYYRFTPDSLSLIFKHFKTTEIIHQGNRFLVLWQVINVKFLRIFLSIFNPLVALAHSKKTNYPCGFIVFARK
jgi:hypothetical protein